ncbi:MAG: 5'-flap endonuclease, partial [Pleopsidium flavum]
MATANVIALSSSPPRSPITTMSPPGFIAIMSSSPGLPSPSMLMRTKRPSLVSGSCAAHMPEKAAVGFASAAGLMIADSPGLGLDAPIAVLTNKGYGHSGSADKFGPDSREEGKTKPKKWAPATVEGVIAAKKSRTPSKKTKKNANMDGVVAHATVLEEFRLPNVEKKPRKPRSKKDKDATQPKIKKGKITKPGTNDGIEKTAIKRKTTPMIKACTVPDSDPNDFGVLTAEQDLGLDEAIRRRKSWTPPKDTSRMAEVSNKDTGSTTESMGAAQESAFEQPAKSFGNLCSSFGYDQPAQSDFAPQALRNLDGVAMTKRRRIEPENLLPGPPAAVPAKRSKSLKKKPQTITEKATAKYAPEDPTPAAPLLQYFAFQEPDTSGDSQGINKESVTQVRAPAKPARRRSSVKSTTAKRKSKKGTVALPILLSPESALKNAKDQDILFGTSSQLMGDESPTFLRDLQQAMKVSEA